ncbi:E3 SUMO-protein ligase ZBED1-like [Lasioglossum baleicum]|uniref:E3 SUMO-protein ligase ZBED1-like n=1 Tax=Lasioglossum baleicum TaxID=434251 RepID=UPI003FCCB8FC
MRSHIKTEDLEPSSNSFGRLRSSIRCKMQTRCSDVWNFFTPANSGYAICNVCKKKLSYKTTTSNLKKHMGAVHPTISLVWRRAHQLQPPQPSTISPDNPSPLAQPGPSRSSPSPSLPPSIPDREGYPANLPQTSEQQITSFIPTRITAVSHKEVDEKLLNLFIKDLHPFSIVEDKGMRGFVEALNPKYKLPNRHYISNELIPSLFEECRNHCKEKIRTAIQICLTTNTWTSQNTENFIAITAHFVNNFKLESILLNCIEMSDSDTSESIANMLKQTCEEWEILNKVNFAITDNSANIRNAITNFCNWEHIPCFAHSLNLIVKSSLQINSINSLLNNVRTIVKYFKRSTVAAHKLRAYQIMSGKDVQGLIHDVPTRWTSTYNMIDRFILLEEPLKTTIGILNKNLPYISHREWETLHELAVILKPIESATKIISGEKCPTASIIIPLISGMRKICRQLKQNDFGIGTHQIITHIEQGIVDRFTDVENNIIVQLYTLLDPRFKDALIPVEKVEILKLKIIDLLNDNANRNAHILNETDTRMLDTHNSTDNLSVWDALDENIRNSSATSSSQEQTVLSEIEQYLNIEFCNRTADPLIWWKDHQFQFPMLKQLTELLPCIVATSVPCERIFSKAGLILNERRNRLKADKLSMVIFLHYNK